MVATLEERFWAKVLKTEGCWLWTGAPNRSDKGYGQLRRGGPERDRRYICAHVLSYELHHGPVPEGLEVRHTCDVSLCVNPAHLTVGTHAENMQDSADRNRYSPRKGLPRSKSAVTSQ